MRRPLELVEKMVELDGKLGSSLNEVDLYVQILFREIRKRRNLRVVRRRRG